MKTIMINTILLFVVTIVAANSFCQDGKGFNWRTINATNFLDDIKTITNPSIKASLLMPDTLYKDSIGTPILLKIENKTLKSLTIRSPNNYGCVSLRLIKDGERVKLIRLISLFDTYWSTQICPHEVREVDIMHGQKLDDLFDLGSNPTGEYTISAIYSYGIKENYVKYSPYRGVETKPKTFYIK